LAGYLALFVIFVIPVVLIVLFWLVHVMPEKIAVWPARWDRYQELEFLSMYPPDDRCRRPWRLRRSGRCPRERRLVSSNVGAARCEPPLGRSAQPDPPRSFAAAVTHLLYGVPVWPGTCFLLSFAQARAGLPVSPVASLAIAVTHWLNGVPC